jgi:hypothetical protein
MRRFLFAVALAAPGVALAVPALLPHQGRLTDTTGQPVTGTHTVTFALYDVPASGTPLWDESLLVAFEDGYFSVTLGTNPLDPIEADDLDGAARYLSVSIPGLLDGAQRQRLASVPYALQSGYVRGGVQLIDNTDTCDVNRRGALRWHQGAVEVCNNLDEWDEVYGASPEILSVSTLTGAAGQTVTVTANNLVPGQMTATLGGVPVALTAQSSTSVSYVAPVTALNQPQTLVLTNASTGRSGSFNAAWTRTTRIEQYLVGGTGATWTVPYSGVVVDVYAVGGGGAGGRSYRTGGADESYGGGGGGGGFALVKGYAVPTGTTTATYTVGAGGPANNPAYPNAANQCQTSPSPGGVSTNGVAGGATSIQFGTDLVVTANGGAGGGGGPNGAAGAGGAATVTGPGATGLPWGVATGGAGSGVNQGAGASGGTVTVASVTYRAAGGGGAGAGNQANPPSNGGNGATNSYTGGAGGGGADSPGAGGPGGTGFKAGGAGENASSGAGFAGEGGTFGGQTVQGGAGGQTGIGRQVTGDPEPGRRNAGGGGGLFGAGGGGGGDSCSAGAGAGAQGVIVVSY